MKKLVIALGGNALQEAGKPATAQAQLEVVEKTSEYIADIVERGYEVIVAHGNGPQVGRIVIQNEVASASTPAMPFDVCGAMSQGIRCLLTTEGHKVETMADCDGLRIRVPSSDVYQETVAAWGCSPTAMSSSQVITSLANGTIEGFESDPASITARGQQESFKYYIETVPSVQTRTPSRSSATTPISTFKLTSSTIQRRRAA